MISICPCLAQCRRRLRRFMSTQLSRSRRAGHSRSSSAVAPTLSRTRIVSARGLGAREAGWPSRARPVDERGEQRGRGLGRARPARPRRSARSTASPGASTVSRTPLATKLSLCSTSAVGSISTSRKPCRPAASSRVPAADAIDGAVLEDADAEALALLGAGDDQPAEPVAGDQVLVDDAAAEEPDPLLDDEAAVAGVGGDAVAQRLAGRAAGDHHPRERRGGAAGGDQRRALRVGAGDRAQDRALLAAVQQRLDQPDLVAAAEQDAAQAGDRLEQLRRPAPRSRRCRW